MSVDVTTYKYNSVLYNTEAYLGVYDYATKELTYEGFSNSFSPYLITLDEWLNLTANMYDETGNSIAYATISGDMNGFSANNWHTKSKIIATDGSTYAIAFAVYRQNPHFYCLSVYKWLDTHPTEWKCEGSNSWEFNGTSTKEEATEIYLKQPEYLYLTYALNIPNEILVGGTYYYDDNGLKFISSAIWGTRGGLLDKLTKVTTAPDPQPVPSLDGDPYYKGGNTSTGGGTGNFDATSDDVDIPSLPTLSAVDAGFITLFNPTQAQLSSLADYMWSDLFDVATFKKIFADPMQAILGLSIVPVAVPSGGQRVVSVGNISTGISMNTALSQYVKVDCGTINVNEYWGAYLDYDPFTRAEIYLPYIGIRPLSVDDIMGKPVHVVYHIDILSGACCAYVKCGGSVLYSFLGQCASSIPVTGNDWTNVINGVLNIAGAVGSMVASGGATAPMGINTIASTAVNSLKPSVEKSGAMGGTGGMLGVQTPYIILTRPRQAVPSTQNVFTGYPSFITKKLGDLSGYTEVYKIHLENIGATEDELNEIESLLKSGVIF